MKIHVIACPNCKQADCLEKDNDFEFNNTFECECGENFSLEEAEIIELESN